MVIKVNPLYTLRERNERKEGSTTIMMLIEPKIKGFICITAHPHPFWRQKSVESMAKHIIDAKRAGPSF